MASRFHTRQQPGVRTLGSTTFPRAFTEHLLCASHRAERSAGLNSFTLTTTKESGILIWHQAGVEGTKYPGSRRRRSWVLNQNFPRPCFVTLDVLQQSGLCCLLLKEKIREPLALWALVRIKVDNGCKYHRVPGSQPSEVRSGPALSSLSHQLPCQGLQAGTDLFHSSRQRAGHCLHTHSHTQIIADQQLFSPGASGARDCPGSTRGGHSGARPLLPLSFWVA